MNNVNQIKGQMLAELIAALGPTAGGGAGAGKPGAAAAAPLPAALTGLAAGETLTARVLPPDADGQPLIAIAGRPIRAETVALPLPPEARTPGATLTLQVAEAGDAPTLRLVSTQPPPAEAMKPAAAPLPATPEAQAREAIRQLTIAAAVRQGSAAPLYADLATLATRPDQPLPALRPIADALLAGRLDAARPVTPEALKAAVAQATGIPLPQGEAPRLDARALLTLLKDAARAIAPPAAPRDDQPPPPARDAAPVAARPAPPALPADAPPETIAAELGRRAEQALERQGLHQLSSLPEPRPAQGAETQRPPTLSFELPIALGQQTAMAGFSVERDPRRRNARGEAIDAWGIRFAIDADGIGPVHAHLRLAGSAKAAPDLSITLWAEDAQTHAAFVAALPGLEAALAESALAVGEIAILPGRPADPPRAARGRLVDRAS